MRKNGQKMLKANKLNAGYGNIQIIWDLSMEVKTGTITALIGANGAGKTTLLRILSGALRAYSGALTYEAEDVTKLSQGKRAKLGIMMIPEGRQLFNALTVQANLMMGAYTRKDRKSIKRDLDWVFGVLPVLKDRRQQLAGTLSGGEAQMCAIGRGLMANPRLLLIDELSLGLAPVVVDSLIKVLQRIHSERAITVLLVDQDVQAALEMASEGYVIANGRVEMAGRAQELLQSPEIQKTYFGI